MFCSQCGQSLTPGASFCAGCGRPVAERITAADLRRPLLVTLLSLLNGAAGVMFLLSALTALYLSTRLAFEDPGRLALGVVAIVLGMLALLALPCAYGLWKLRPYGRALQILLALIGLIMIPLGTLISILLLIYLFHPGVRVLFSGKPAQDLGSAEVAALHRLSSQSGWILVVTVAAVSLLGIGLTGIVAAIAIPNFLNAIDRGKQKSTMADIRSIAIAVEQYWIDYDHYPVAGSIRDLQAAVQPVYIKVLPTRDGWQKPFSYAAWREDLASGGPDHYAIGSPGKDGTWEHNDVRDYEQSPTLDFDRDIILREGVFIQYPEGLRGD